MLFRSAPALNILSHALNLDWRSVSHMIIYMFQCYSLRSSHPHLLPQSPGVMHETGCSGLEHWDDPEGWDGEGGGRGAQDGEPMYIHGGFMSMYGKNH